MTRFDAIKQMNIEDLAFFLSIVELGDINSIPNITKEDINYYINYLKEKHGIKGEEVLFVGNGANDQTVYLSGARTLCINPDDADYKNKKYWDFYMENCENLTEIIPFLEKEKQREDLQK